MVLRQHKEKEMKLHSYVVAKKATTQNYALHCQDKQNLTPILRTQTSEIFSNYLIELYTLGHTALDYFSQASLATAEGSTPMVCQPSIMLFTDAKITIFASEEGRMTKLYFHCTYVRQFRLPGSWSKTRFK